MNPKIATNDELQEYVHTIVYEFVLEKFSDSNMKDLFTDAFHNFDTSIFDRLPHRELLRLRSLLRCGGVYVAPNTKHLTIAQTLDNVLERRTYLSWTKDDSDTTFEALLDSVIADSKALAATHIKSAADIKSTANTTNPAQQPPAPQQPALQPLQQLALQPPVPQPPAAHAATAPPPLQPTATSFMLAIAANPVPQYQSQPQHPIQPSQPQSQVSLGTKLISEVAKIYTEEQKYDGTNGSFDHKLTIFLDICQRVELPQEALMRAFPAMLKGLALDHYYNALLSQCTYQEACDNIRGFFERPGYHRRNLDQWNAITLASVTVKNPDKSTYENVLLLINELRQLQYGLTPALRSTEFLHDKIVTSCQGSPACRYAVSDPPPGLAQLINKLQSSITSHEKELDATTHDIFFTDRRYYRNRQQRYQGRKYKNNYNPSRQRNVCFVCRKEGCRSWKHTPQEQDDSKAQFKSRNLGRFNTKSSNFSKRFDESYRQYIAEFEGDIDDDLEEFFGALLVDNDDDSVIDTGASKYLTENYGQFLW
jgi:hypothetical protein